MAIISLANSKGGCGKTTLSVNLATALPAVLVDADPQASSVSAGAGGNAKIVSIPVGERSRIPEFLNRVLRLAKHGHVIVDCPASLNDTTRAALMIADLCIVPVTPSPLDLRAAKFALEAWRETREWRRGLPEVMLVPNRVDLRTKQGREIVAILQNFGSRVAPAIGYRMAFVEAAAVGKPVMDFAPDSPAAREIECLTQAIRIRLDALEALPARSDPWRLQPSDRSMEAMLPTTPALAGLLKTPARSGFFSKLLSWG